LGKKAVSGIMLTLLLTILVLISFTPLSRSQPPDGEWIVTGVEVVENKTIELSGNLTVKSGGSLTLRSVTLGLNVERNGQYGISVEEGGSLFIYNSNISSATAFRFFFRVVGGSFVMKNSELHGAGFGEWGEGGVWIQTDDTLIDGNLISDGYGVVLNGSDNCVINNNRFMNTDQGIFTSESKHNLIVNNTIHRKEKGSAENGIWIVRSGDNVIANNVIFECTYGIRMTSGWNNTITSNLLIGGMIFGYSCIEIEGSHNNTIANNTIRSGQIGIHVLRSVNNKVEENFIEGLIVGVMLSYAYNNVVANNNLSNIFFSPSGPNSFPWHYTDVDAIHLYHSSNNAIINNWVSSVQSNAIILWEMSSNNTLQANVINSSHIGISLHYSSDNNKIINNVVSHIVSKAMILDESNGNIAYHNSFLDPVVDAYDNGMNHWSFGGQGNYWGDYEGQDKDGNGVGDVPRCIPPNGTDSFPLMNPKPAAFVPIPKLEKLEISNLGGQEVVISTEETWKNIAVTAYRIHVKEGGNLTLKNVTLTIVPFGMGIMVDPGGSMYIYDSIITAADPRYAGYDIHVFEAKEFVMKNSELHYAGLESVETNTTIENNVFAHNYRGIKVQGPNLRCRIANNIITYSQVGIVSDTGYISNNTISKMISAGVLAGPNGVQIIGNNISHVWGGAMILQWTHGLVPSAINNTISNSEVGMLIFAGGGPGGLFGFRVVNNVISDTQRGAIQILPNVYAPPTNVTLLNCVVTNNTILNSAGGIYLATGTQNLLIYHNNMINSPNSSDLGSNDWDYKGEGNHWSDYTGVDSNGDGIGDTPYYIPPNGVDRYPLMDRYKPYISPHDIGILRVTPSKNIFGRGFTLPMNVKIKNYGNYTESFNVTAYYNANPIATQTVTLASGSYTTITFRWKTTGVAKGSYTISAYTWPILGEGEIDDNLYVDGTVQIVDDNTPPTTMISLSGVLGNNGWFTSEVTVTMLATDDLSGVDETEYSFDNVTWITYTAPFTVVNEGYTTLYRKSTDGAGNVETIKAETIKIDKTPPSCSINAPISGGWYQTATLPSLKYTVVETNPYTVVETGWSTAEGKYIVTVTATDAAGNAGSASITYTVDNTPPVITISGAANEAWYSANVTITWSVADNLDPNPAATANYPSPTMFSTEGSHTITVSATDKTGNTASKSLSFAIDKAPTVTAIDMSGTAGLNGWYVSDVTVSLTATDPSPSSGVKEIHYILNGAKTVVSGSTTTFTLTAEGINTLEYWTVDNAGNSETAKARTLKIDKTPPVANAGRDQTVIGETVSFDASGSMDNVGIVSYQWDFGDGRSGTGKTTTHTYTYAKPTYTVTLTVKDAAGNKATHSITVTVFPTWIMVAVIVAIVVVIGAVFARRKTKTKA